MARLDFHLHTGCSPDSLSALRAVALRCRQVGLSHVCVTDHNTIKGAVAMKEVSALPVIAGEEIRTLDGEIIGLFLQELVLPNRPAAETVEAIKAQGGLVYIPHPADPRRHALRPEALERVRDQVDIIEAFNARCIQESSNRAAEALADRLGCARVASSDAHTLGEIGRSYVECADFATPWELVVALRDARLHRRRSPLTVHLWSRYAVARHRLGGEAGRMEIGGQHR